jgi:PAS domain S-box-containing protein
VTISPEGKITDVNEATVQVTGALRDRLIGSDFSDYFTEPEEAREGYQQVFQEGFVRDYPLAIRHGSGKITDVLYNATVYKDTSGKVLGVFAAARDMTERQKIEEQFLATSAYARSLIEASLDPLVTISPEGKITDVNHATEQVTGVSKEWLIGTDFSTYFTEPRKARQGYRQVFREGAVRDYPLAIRHSSGRIVDVLYNASVYRDAAGKVRGVFAAARDVTDTKGASQYARSLIEASLDPLVTISPEGKITDVNEATVQVTGAPRDRLIGSDFSDYFTDPNQAREGYRQVFSKGTVTDYPLTIRSATGKLTDVLYNASVYRDEKGSVLGVFAAARDYSRLKQTTVELEDSNKDLEAFSYTVSHDLRAPLRAIDGFSLALLEEYREKLDSQGIQYLTRVRESSQFMGKLIDDLLGLSRVSRTPINRQTVDLSALASTIANSLRRGQATRKVEFVIADSQIADGDPVLLRTVLENLLGNAWKFTSEHASAKIEFGGASQDGRPVYFVRDDGVGFDMAYMDKLFTPFQRLHTKEKFEGTGIGLAAVKSIINRHGGRVWVEAAVERGATFYFTLQPERSGA